MEFKEAVKICLTKKYCCFKGRASRSEFWWLCLFTFILNLVVALLGSLLPALGSIVSAVQALWLLLPTVGVTTRRLHDRNLSGFLAFAEGMEQPVAPEAALDWLHQAVQERAVA